MRLTSEQLRGLGYDQDGRKLKALDPAASNTDKMVEAVFEVKATTDEDALNQTEKRYLAFLKTKHLDWIGIQCLTFKLGHDCRYTADFVVVDKGSMTAVDVKGQHTWEDALIKLRTAARMFRWCRFCVVKQNPDGTWREVVFRP